jgi:Zn finger protein HypA/HybF involved in hydrogenase expression
MSNKSLQEAVDTALKFYIENNKLIPNSVVEYIKEFPKGMSRQAIQAKYGIKCSEFVKLLNPSYEKPMEASKRALVEATRLRYKLISDPNTLKTNRDKVSLECLDCGYIHTTTITSLSGSSLGCPLCKSGNLPWYSRKEELEDLLLENFNCELISPIPENETGYIKVKHLECGTEYTSQLVGMVHPNTINRGYCPNCRSTDRRVTLEGITFGSLFESECYKLLKVKNPELHIKYSEYFNTSKKWVCDFKIGNLWIEVSNFKTDYKNYFQNILDKEQLVESNGEYFFFIRSLKEMEDLILSME